MSIKTPSFQKHFPLTCLTAGILLSAATGRADHGHGGHRHAVPFSMDASATAFTTPEFVGDHMFLDVFGTGSGTILGPFTFAAPHDFNLANGTYVSDAYITGACGDVLHVVTVGQFINAVDSVGTWTIEGGTGRFEDATGSGTVVNLNFGAAIHFEGTIAGFDARGEQGR